jgi:hypothetical protein
MLSLPGTGNTGAIRRQRNHVVFFLWVKYNERQFYPKTNSFQPYVTGEGKHWHCKKTAMSLKKILQFFAVLLLLWLGSTPLRSLQAQDDFPLIIDRIRAAFTTGTVSAQDNSVAANLATQAANGSWPDINYADK